MRSSAEDASFVVWLDDVDRGGRSSVISYANLRASHRAVGTAPYDTAGSAWHLRTRAVVETTPALNIGAVYIEPSLLPIANRFPHGHRIRVTIAGADAGNLEVACPGAIIGMLTGPSHPSSVELSVL